MYQEVPINIEIRDLADEAPRLIMSSVDDVDYDLRQDPSTAVTVLLRVLDVEAPRRSILRRCVLAATIGTAAGVIGAIAQVLRAHGHAALADEWLIVTIAGAAFAKLARPQLMARFPMCTTRAQRAAVVALASLGEESEDVRIAGPLLEARYCWLAPWDEAGRRAVDAALTRILPQMTPPDAARLGRPARAELDGIIDEAWAMRDKPFWHRKGHPRPDLYCSALTAQELVPGAQLSPALMGLARMSATTPARDEVRHAAQECLLGIQFRAVTGR